MECQRYVRVPASPSTGNKTAPFDSLRFSIVPRLNYWMDGRPGKRTLFIEDEDETMLISFEEGMRCLDLLDIDRDSPICTRKEHHGDAPIFIWKFRMKQARSGIYPGR